MLAIDVKSCGEEGRLVLRGGKSYEVDVDRGQGYSMKGTFGKNTK